MKNISKLIQAQARQKSQSDKFLRELFCQRLDEALIDHIDFIQVENGVLNCSVQSSAWASRLRFFGDELLGIAKGANIPVQRIKISINTRPKPDELIRPHAPNTKSIPAASLGGLDAMTGTMEDSGLKSALERLVKTAREKNRE